MITCKAIAADEDIRKTLAEILLDITSNKNRCAITRIYFFLFAFCALYIGSYFYIIEEMALKAIGWFVISVVFFVLGAHIKKYQFARIKKKIRSIQSKYPLENNSWTHIFSEKHIKLVGTVNEVVYDWSLFPTYADLDPYVYLPSPDKHVILIDKNSLSDEEISELNDLLDRKSHSIFR